MALQKRSMLNSADMAWASVSEKSLPPSKNQISRQVSCWLDTVPFTFSTSRFSLPFTQELVLASALFDEVVDDAAVKVFTTKMTRSVTGRHQILKGAVVDGKEEDM